MIGIDLGTVYSCVGVFRNGNVEIIANSQGHRITPSIVAFTDRGRLTGDSAKNQRSQNPENTIYDAKRLIGRRYADVPKDDIAKWPFQVINEDGSPMFEVSSKQTKKIISPVQISADILIEMKKIAEDYLDQEVIDAVITVPAYFNDSQRQATKDAAELAGLNVLRLINEPTAASIAYGLNAKVSSDQNILVFDMGGGTFDVSILSIDGDVYEVKAVGGDTHLGGEDFNNKLLDHFLSEIERNYRVDLLNNKRAISELLTQCELAKIALSTAKEAKVHVKSLINGADFNSSITRARFEDLNTAFFKKAIEIVEDTIVQAKLKKSEIHEVVLVGGSTYIPKVQQMLQECFKGKTLNKSIKPDEAVAYGAAVYASILSGEQSDLHDLLLLDVTPHSLGIEHSGGLFHKLITRNSPIPLEISSDRFSTARNNQSVVPIKVYEGEKDLAIQNNLLGRFHLKGLTKAPAKELRITVTFKIDENGILKVTASESTSSAENSLEVDVYKSGAGAGIEKNISKTDLEEAKARIRLFKQKLNLGDIQEKELPNFQFQSGLENFSAGKFDAAFENFSNALLLDESLIEAMEKRAMIHFKRKEFDECVIECEEILTTKDSTEIKKLMEKAKKGISANEPWHEVLKVPKNSDTNFVAKAFKKLANLFHPNKAKNARLSNVDKKKITARMAKINNAKVQFESK